MIAREHATEIARELWHWCKGRVDYMTVAGSLRRGGGPYLKDIDLVAKVSGPRGPLLERLVADTQADDAPFRCENKHPDESTKLWKLVHDATRTPIDLFVCRPEAWGWIYLVRTGPSEFGKALVSMVEPWGFKFDGGRLNRIVTGGIFGDQITLRPIRTPTERSVFEALGLEYLPVELRHPQRLEEIARRRRVEAT